MMDTDPMTHVAVVLDRPAAGNIREAIEQIAPLRLRSLVGRATRLIARYHVADPAFDAEDTVQAAFLNLCRALHDGRIDPMEDEEQTLKILRHVLDQEVLDERAREGALKRRGGRSGTSQAGQASNTGTVDADFDVIDSHTLPADEQVIAQEEVDATLENLALLDPSLRAVAAKKAEGFTHREIAGLLGLPLSAVERRVRAIKAFLGPAGAGLRKDDD
jgi:RNA polymerase sigma factor (sigma-70 family)